MRRVITSTLLPFLMPLTTVYLRTAMPYFSHQKCSTVRGYNEQAKFYEHMMRMWHDVHNNYGTSAFMSSFLSL